MLIYAVCLIMILNFIIITRKNFIYHNIDLQYVQIIRNTSSREYLLYYNIYLLY